MPGRNHAWAQGAAHEGPRHFARDDPRSCTGGSRAAKPGVRVSSVDADRLSAVRRRRSMQRKQPCPVQSRPTVPYGVDRQSDIYYILAIEGGHTVRYNRLRNRWKIQNHQPDFGSYRLLDGERLRISLTDMLRCYVTPRPAALRTPSALTLHHVPRRIVAWADRAPHPLRS